MVMATLSHRTGFCVRSRVRTAAVRILLKPLAPNFCPCCATRDQSLLPPSRRNSPVVSRTWRGHVNDFGLDPGFALSASANAELSVLCVGRLVKERGIMPILFCRAVSMPYGTQVDGGYRPCGIATFRLSRHANTAREKGSMK